MLTLLRGFNTVSNEPQRRDTIMTLSIGDTVTTWDLLDVPENVQVKRTATGEWEVIDAPAPEFSALDMLAVELWNIAYPGDAKQVASDFVSPTVAQGFLNIAAWVNDKLSTAPDNTPPAVDVLSEQHVPRDGDPVVEGELPEKLRDGDGDPWFLGENAKYTMDYPFSNGRRTVDYIASNFGGAFHVSDE